MYMYCFGQLASQCLKGAYTAGGSSSMHAMQQTCESLCCLPRFPIAVGILSGGMGQYKGAGG